MTCTSALATPCSTIDLPGIPNSFKPVPQANMTLPDVRKACDSVMPWCEKLWIDGDSKVTVIAGSESIDKTALQTLSKNQFIAVLNNVPAQLKPRYPANAATDFSASEFSNGLFMTAFTAQYADGDRRLTDIRESFYFDPECRLDLLISGPSREVAETVKAMAPEIERFRANLKRLYADGIEFKTQARFAQLPAMLGFWLAGLLVAWFLLGIGAAHPDHLPFRVIKVWLFALLALYLWVGVTQGRAAAICQAWLPGTCDANAPVDLSFLVFCALVSLTLIYGILTRRPGNVRGIAWAILLQQILLAGFLIYSQGLSIAVAPNGAIVLVTALLLAWRGRRPAPSLA